MGSFDLFVVIFSEKWASQSILIALKEFQKLLSIRKIDFISFLLGFFQILFDLAFNFVLERRK
jgi:hypothetical protein